LKRGDEAAFGSEKASERPWNQRVPRPLFILEKIKFGDGMERAGMEWDDGKDSIL
jgi:hypothetical protein